MGPLATGNVTVSGNYITGSQTGLFGTASWDRGLWTDGGGVTVTVANNTFQYTRTAINADAALPSLIALTGNTIKSSGSGVSLGVNYANVTITGTTLENVGTEFNFRNLAVDVTFNASGAITGLTTGFGSNDLVLVLGGSGNDTLTGTTFADVLDGNNLNVNNADNDILTGGDGDDQLLGRAGNDTLNGGNNNDTITGGAGTDSIDGGAGNDTIVYTSGAELTAGETVDGGADTDTISYTPSAADTLTITANVTNVEAVTIGGTAAGSVNASAAVNGLAITGNDAANTLWAPASATRWWAAAAATRWWAAAATTPSTAAAGPTRPLLPATLRTTAYRSREAR